MPRDRIRFPDEVTERDPGTARPRPGPDFQIAAGAPADRLRGLQRLAGNAAVTELLSSHRFPVQRADAGVPATATPDAGVAETAADPAVERLDLQSDVADAARELKKAIPAVVFNSGRRTLERDASLVAGHIVANRDYVNIFADSRPKRLIKAWVDGHPEAGQSDVTTAIIGILEPMGETERSYWSLHLGGRAFDVDSGSCTLDEVKKLFPQTFAEEGHWHVQFPAAWSKK